MPARNSLRATPLASTDEKITVNLGCVDLGQLDLLVQEGFYANRSDFIRTAIRNLLGNHQAVVREAAARRTLVLGTQHYTAADLQSVADAGQTLDIRVLGLASFADDVTPALALATVSSLSVLGTWHASPAVRAALIPACADNPVAATTELSMNPNFQRLMSQAAELTRTGDLQAATAALQSALSGNGAPLATSPMAPPPVPATRLAGAPLAAAKFVAAALGGAPFTAGPQDPSAPYAGMSPPVPSAAPSTGPAATPTAAPSTAPRGSTAQGDEAHATVGARFVGGDFSCTAGRRAYKLYIPPQAGSKPLPLVVMLHGCTQSPDDFAAGTAMNEAAFAQGFFVLYPAQSQDANPQRCWNWFKHSHQQRGRGEPLLLAGMTQQVMATHAIDPQRVYVAGLSAGGAMAAILGDCYPDLFAAVGVHSGLAAGAASDLPTALAAMRNGAPARGAPAARTPAPPTIVFHGSADTTVHPGNGEQAAAAGAATGTGGDCIMIPMAATPGKRAATRQLYQRADGSVASELWLVDGAPHAWSGGSTAGSYTDPRGPDASKEMLRFFFERSRTVS